MATFIVSYQPGEFYQFCTNIAVAESKSDVERRYREDYEGIRCLSVREAEEHEVEALRRRGCPVVKCARRDDAGDAKRMLDRLIDRIEDLELDCDEGVYDALLKIQYAMA